MFEPTVRLAAAVIVCSLATVRGAVAGPYFQVGSFTKSVGAAPATQTVSHTLGVVPKAIIFWTNGKTNQTVSSGYRFGFGLTDGTTSKAVATSDADAVSTTVVGRRMTNTAVVIIDPAGTAIAEADLQSWNSSGFTLNWTTNDATATVIHFLAIGGPKVAAKVINWTMPIAVGNQAVTGVGFQPEVVVNAHIGAAVMTAPPTTATNASFALSWFDASGEQASLCTFGNNASAPSLEQRYQRADKALIGSSNIVTKEATWVSMDSDGFTLNYTTANTSNGQMISLALHGVSSQIGSFTKATGAAPASQQITGLRFRPRAVLFASVQAGSSASIGSQSRTGLGATDGSTDGSVAFQATDGSNPSSVQGIDKTSKSFVKIDNGSSTIDAEASTSSLDSAGFTLNWTTNDAVATEIFYLALAPPRRVMILGMR